MGWTTKSRTNPTDQTASESVGNPILRRILIVVRVPGNPRGCCGRKDPRDNYRMAKIYADGTIEVTKQYDGHLQLIRDHGKWAGSYSTISQPERDLIDAAYFPAEGETIT